MQYLATPPARGCRLPPFLINLSCFKKGQREKKRISVWNDNACNVRDRRTLVWPFWQQLLLEGLSVEVFFFLDSRLKLVSWWEDFAICIHDGLCPDSESCLQHGGIKSISSDAEW